MPLPNPPAKIASRVDHAPKEVAAQKQTPDGADASDRAEIAIESESNNSNFTALAQAAQEFLTDVLPEVPGGHYGLWTKHDKRLHCFSSAEDMLGAQFGEFLSTPDIYFGTAVFGNVISKKTGSIARSKDNVIGRLCLHADIDCGEVKYAAKPDETYPTQRDALKALTVAVKSGLIPMPSYIIDSGTGLHLYWCSDQPIAHYQWGALANALKEKAQVAGIKFDPACTGDSSRLLRMPGALHSCGKRVRVLKRTGLKYSQQQLAQILGATDEGNHLSVVGRKQTGMNADVLAYDGPPAEFDLIVQGCGAVRWAVTPENQRKVNRDYWRGLLGIVKHCAGADELAHAVSKHHPEYDEDTTDHTLAGWETAPTTCEYFSRFDGVNGGACANCPHVNGGVQ